MRSIYERICCCLELYKHMEVRCHDIYLLCFASKHHTTIALKKLGHHNSLTPITVGPLQNININIENRNN